MDRLDGLLHTARPLLSKVDEMLSSAGAPADHRVWDELRRVRLLPGDAARAIAALRPSALGDAGPELRAEALREWMEQTRDEVAAALASALSSSEAITLVAGGGLLPPAPADVLAAADIAAHLLRTVADNYDNAADLIEGSSGLTSEVPI